MNKKVLLCMCLISTFSYGKVNDYRGVLTEQQRTELDNLTIKFENETGIKLNINMVPEGFNSELKQKEITLNLIEKLNEAEIKLGAQLQVSNDINTPKKMGEIKYILNESEKNATVGNEFELSKDFIKDLEAIFKRDDSKQSPEKKEKTDIPNTENKSKMKLSTKIILGILLTFFLLSIRILQVKRLKRLHREKQRRKKMQQRRMQQRKNHPRRK